MNLLRVFGVWYRSPEETAMQPTDALPPPAASPARMTAEEFIQLHGGEADVELVKGRVVRLPMPGALHGRVCTKANFYLTQYELESNLGRTLGNDTFIRTGTNPDTYRGADVCFLSYQLLPKEKPLPSGPLEIAPELVIEVRSPSDRRSHILFKIGEYWDAGVQAVILLDPEIEFAGVYQPTEDFPQRFSNGDDLVIPDVLPGFRVPVRKFFE